MISKAYSNPAGMTVWWKKINFSEKNSREFRLHNILKSLLMVTYDTLTSAIAGLREKGYDLDFNIAFDQILCRQNGVCLNPDQFEITEHYRFEGNSNPDDSDILFAVESKDGSMKGLLVDAYGAYADPISDELIRKLHVREQ